MGNASKNNGSEIFTTVRKNYLILLFKVADSIDFFVTFSIKTKTNSKGVICLKPVAANAQNDLPFSRKKYFGR